MAPETAIVTDDAAGLSLWEKYRGSSGSNFVTATFEGLGMPEWWVKIRKIGSMTIEEIARLELEWREKHNKFIADRIAEQVDEAVGKLQDRSESEVDMDEALDALSELTGDEEEAIMDARTRARYNITLRNTLVQSRSPLLGLNIALIDDWNLSDPETDEHLPVPKEDLATLDRLPLEIAQHIRDLIQVVAEVASYPPKGLPQSITQD